MNKIVYLAHDNNFFCNDKHKDSKLYAHQNNLPYYNHDNAINYIYYPLLYFACTNKKIIDNKLIPNIKMLLKPYNKLVVSTTIIYPRHINYIKKTLYKCGINVNFI